MKISNLFGHLKTITKHKLYVFKYAVKAGIPWRGFMHDWSKYTPTELIESVKYYQGGKRSPVPVAREAKGYSDAWLHHKGRNRHHFEYWYDFDKGPVVMPLKFAIEMICDKLAASKVYEGKNWTNESEIRYWNEKEKDKTYIHPKIKAFVAEVFEEVAEKGIDPVINKKRLTKIYNKNCK